MIPQIFMPRRIALAVVLVVVSALFPEFTAQADVRILSSPGGAVDAYLAAFARVRQSGERVVIDGHLRLVPNAKVELKSAGSPRVPESQS